MSQNRKTEDAMREKAIRTPNLSLIEFVMET